MSKQTLFPVITVVISIWLGSMAWLSGYKQGYSEGAETGWDDARNAFSTPIPVLKIDPIEVSSTNR